MSNPTITGLEVRGVRVPLDPPHRTASGIITESPLVLTDVMTSPGVVGHSLIFTYAVAALKPTADLIKNIAPMIAGDALAPSDVYDKFAKRFRLLGMQGLVAMAIAAIDMALWDAVARMNNTSLARLLGSDEKSIPAYGAVGYDGVRGSATTAEVWARRGFKGVKAKIGYPTVEEDLEVVRAMRSAVGPDVAVMIDYNQSLTPAEAVHRLRTLDDEGLTWIEEPMMAHDFNGHSLVAREIKTPIQSGENWWGTTDLQNAIEAHASDYVMLDIMKIGGVTGWLRAISLAEGATIPISNHLWPEISSQVLCVCRSPQFLEYADWWNPVLKNPLVLRDGMSMIEGTLGSGVEWNEEAISKYLV